MPTTLELIQQVTTLPVEDQNLVVDSLLRSLNAPDPDVDAKWAEVAETRLTDLRSGKCTPIPGDAVFSEILENDMWKDRM